MGEDREEIAENESSQEKLCKRQVSVNNTGDPVWEEFSKSPHRWDSQGESIHFKKRTMERSAEVELKVKGGKARCHTSFCPTIVNASISFLNIYFTFNYEYMCVCANMCM